MGGIIIGTGCWLQVTSLFLNKFSFGRYVDAGPIQDFKIRITGKYLKNKRRIEEAALNAWPALQQILYDGWILRFSQGYTKRANSVNPIYSGTIAIETKVVRCESHYHSRNLATIFRLTSLLDQNSLDAHLETRGYQRIDPTLVIGLDLRPSQFDIPTAVEVGEFGFKEWFGHFSAWSNTHPPPKENHQR